MQSEQLTRLLEVFMTLQVTKELPRQGFINFGFKRNDSDSVAAHSFTVAALAFLLALHLKKDHPKVDENQVLRMALVHDMGEAISGDVGYHVKRFAGEMFHQVEEQTFSMLVDGLEVKDELKDIFHRYNELDSTEARIVKLADVLDAYMQMYLTPGAEMKSVDMFMQEKSKSLENDPMFGNELKDLFEQAIELVKGRKILFLGT